MQLFPQKNVKNGGDFMEIKQWYDADGFTLNSVKRLGFSQCGPNGDLTIFELLKMTSDIATEDVTLRGTSSAFLREHNILRMVSRSSFRLHKMPKEGEVVLLTTAVEIPEEFQQVRSYEFSAEDGTPLISGVSTWIMVEADTHRIIPSEKFTLLPKSTISRTHNCLPYGRIKAPSQMEFLSEYKIGYANLDSNGHTNNSWYGFFMMNSLPDSLRTKKFTDFRINYSKEATLGQTLGIYAHHDEEKRTITVVGKVDNVNSFESTLIY